ncbi:MAG: MFS transporter [Bacteroidetes bacterium]|nr:MFS transporter [Bacteroidota bacterium]
MAIIARSTSSAFDFHLHTAFQSWRYRIFGVTWLLYAGYYLCRKNYAVAQPVFMQEFGWNEHQVGIIISTYLTMYAAGQFISGPLGDRYGARRIIIIGLSLSVMANLLFSQVSSILLMAVLMGINGLAQSTGWPNSMKTMSNWFSLHERGRMMAWWGTNYQIGDIVSTALAAFIISFATWHEAFWIPSIGLVVVGVVFLWGQRNRPEDAGLPSIIEYLEQEPSEKDKKIEPVIEMEYSLKDILKEVLWNKYIWNLGFSYFFLKLVRYTFLFWLSTYLVQVIGFRADKAGYMSVIFPLAGFLGTVAAGYSSDKFFSARRGPVSVIMLLMLLISIYAYSLFAAHPILGPLVLGFIGFNTFGPDTLISATAAMDFGTRKASSTAAGFINGLGSIGAALSGVLVAWISVEYGWSAVFYFLMVATVACIILQFFMWNAQGKN